MAGDLPLLLGLEEQAGDVLDELADVLLRAHRELDCPEVAEVEVELRVSRPDLEAQAPGIVLGDPAHEDLEIGQGEARLGHGGSKT